MVVKTDHNQIGGFFSFFFYGLDLVTYLGYVFVLLDASMHACKRSWLVLATATASFYDIFHIIHRDGHAGGLFFFSPESPCVCVSCVSI